MPLVRVTTAPGNLSSLDGGGWSGSATTPTISESRMTRARFVIPDVAPDKKDWVPDVDAGKCMVCMVEVFSMVR